MDKRVAKRVKRRMTCEILVGSQSYAGIVLDVSATGLFIQTNVAPPPDTVVEIRLAQQRDMPRIDIRAVVVRHKRADRRLVSLVSGGVGVQILDAPDAYYHQLLGCERPTPGATASQEEVRTAGTPVQLEASEASAGDGKYEVRVSKLDSPRSRTLSVVAANDEAAKQEALDQVGEGWEVVDVSAC